MYPIRTNFDPRLAPKTLFLCDLPRRERCSRTFHVSPKSSHLLNRMATFFGADGPAEDGNAPRPGFRHRAEAERGYDTFDDAYTRFAGRGAWERGFDAERL